MYYSNINTLTNINKCNTIKYIYDYLITWIVSGSSNNIFIECIILI